MDAVAMELAAVRHGCKVCGKSFSSGRSLGGHMRSHLSLGDTAAAAAEGDAAADEVVRASANGGRSSSNGVLGYGLRENPRKTRRLSDFADEEEERDGGDGGVGGDGDGEHNKACRECGKLFSSWKSLSGHMRSHASGGRDRDCEEDMHMEEEEFVPEEAEAEEEMVVTTMEAPALAMAPRRRRRTMRVAAPPPGSPAPVISAGFEKEPEDVALCLLMLSRDTGLWSSPPPVVKKEPFESRAKKPAGLPRSGFAYNSDDDDSAMLRHGGAKIKGRVLPKGRKRSSPKQQQQQLDAAMAPTPKRTRYECPGCGKVFTSYQALGGHRASHKRINTSCSAPKVTSAAVADAPEPSTETYTASFSTLSPSSSPDSVAIGFGNPNAQVEKLECSVCFRVFSSVQALGGHKRTHLVPAGDGELYAGEADQEEEEHSAADAGFLDLNFPPVPPEEA